MRGYVFWFPWPLSRSGAATPLEGAHATDCPEAQLLKTAAAPGLRFSGRLGGGTSRTLLLRVWAGLPGLLRHLTRPADASFWSELVATWAPISETQIKCPSILQKPRRAQGQPGLLPVFHGRILPPTVRAPTAAAAHRPTRGASQIVHTPYEVGGCEDPVMGPWDIWSHGNWRNISNLRYADDTTLMAESEEELKSLLVRVKEEREKAALKLSIQKTKVMVPSLHGK